MILKYATASKVVLCSGLNCNSMIKVMTKALALPNCTHRAM